jgi:hypothetical protein
MVMRSFGRTAVVLALLVLGLTACAGANLNVNGPLSMVQSTVTLTPFQPILATMTPRPTETPIPTPTPVPTQTPTLPPIPGVWTDLTVPDGLRQELHLPQSWQWVADASTAALRLRLAKAGEAETAHWVYTLVAPFPTVTDEVSLDQVKSLWKGERGEVLQGKELLVSASTRRIFEVTWGPGSQDTVVVMTEDRLLDEAWKTGAWALIPFERLEPRWKVLRVNGHSPLERGTLTEEYPLTVAYHLEEINATEQMFRASGGVIPATNRDPQRMTVVLMTGTTALVRAVGWKMETQGMTTPARDIADWLHDADFTHVSNEASFNPKCPAADPNQKSLMFCSRPEYIRLFEEAGVNLIELTGNHNSDWGKEAFNYTLDLFQQHGWQWFGGGADAEKAAQPLLIEHNGNKLAFIGCNLPGPPNAWATADEPGAARCNLDALDQELARLKAQGYLAVMTFQYNEIYVPYPSEGQARDFKRMSDAGAVIVSGSQAHFPQGFSFENGNLIHYGLGNLFFDQMDIPVVGTRREFLDRHVFYNGRHISSEILTAMLEDYSRPRPMTAEERSQFLTDIFHATGW